MSRAPAHPLPPERFEDLLREEAAASSLSCASMVSLSRYLSELDHWRRRINLTGQLTAEDLVDHALESLVPSDLLSGSGSLIDIGSGAGLPGAPLAIVSPDISVTLLEPRARRAAFLRHLVRALPLPNTRVLESRIEEVGGQTFGAAATRAVGRLDRLLRNAPFLEPGGLLLLWTTEPDERARELPAFELELVRPVPGSRRRVVAAFRKRS
jgi:16S rRNA (guanine527-N7)-methyltransferase